jgi:hypothetical protein
VFAAIQDLLNYYFTASSFFCLPSITGSQHYVADKFSYTPVTREYIVGQHSSPNCVIILANFNILFFLLDTDTFSSMNAVIHHHIFTFINHFSLQCTQNSIFISAYCDLIKEVKSTDLQYLCLSITISIFQSTLKQQQTSEQHNFACFFFSKPNLSHCNYLKFV